MAFFERLLKMNNKKINTLYLLLNYVEYNNSVVVSYFPV